jgi:hypothetical protein
MVTLTTPAAPISFFPIPHFCSIFAPHRRDGHWAVPYLYTPNLPLLARCSRPHAEPKSLRACCRSLLRNTADSRVYGTLFGYYRFIMITCQVWSCFIRSPRPCRCTHRVVLHQDACGLDLPLMIFRSPNCTYLFQSLQRRRLLTAMLWPSMSEPYGTL